jgi:hypothetical protein
MADRSSAALRRRLIDDVTLSVVLIVLRRYPPFSGAKASIAPVLERYRRGRAGWSRCAIATRATAS